MNAQTKGDPGYSPWTAPKPKINYSDPNFTEAERVSEALSHIPAHDRELWVKVGMAVKSALGEQGFSIWDEWSKSADNYRARDCVDVWKSIKPLGGIGAGTLYHLAREYGWSDDLPYTPPSAKELAERERLQREYKAHQARRHAEAADKASRLLAAGKPATASNPYLRRKGIENAPQGAFTLSEAEVRSILNYAPCAKGEALTGEILILPITKDGELTGAELIDEEGRKAALAGSVKSGGCWQPAPIPTGAATIAIAEGAATALSAHAATDWPVIAALSSNNLEAIAKQIRRDHPGAEIVVCADLDKSTREPDPHAVKAAEAVGGRLAVPALSSEEGKDWNDAFLVHGLESTRAALLSVMEQAPPEHPAITKAGALREAVRLAMEIHDPVARALELAEIGKAHLGAKSPTAPTTFIESAERGDRRTFPKPPADLRLLTATREEREAARLAPRCIVSRHTYADVGTVSGAGGSGKTTHMLWEGIHILTGRPLYGLEVEQPGPVIFVTAEDPRGVVLARLHRVMQAMDPPLSDTETGAVEAGFIVLDVSGDLSRLVDIDAAGRIMPTGFADAIIEAARPLKPALIVMDPIVSFGPGETRVNDVEQALILEARRIVRGVDCCVRFISHVSQAAARAGTLDQYASRGGTALSDGSRMVTVLAAWHPGDKDEPPITLEVPGGASIIKLARPKLSYCPPQPLIWLCRDGYRFTWALAAPPMTSEIQLAADANQVESWLVSELSENRRYTRRTLDTARFRFGLGRDQLRRALAELEISRRVIDAPLPVEERYGRRQTYLHPTRANARAPSAQ